ncbi:replication initiator protein A [Bacillus piscicola]|uniref:replication initiator protein A n=1 Tax=Bacillus piscicola TaxID=1632684 RepID=UPI001F098E66|nr:replication initiator protein A [Bacillus piscicola]
MSVTAQQPRFLIPFKEEKKEGLSIPFFMIPQPLTVYVARGALKPLDLLVYGLLAQRYRLSLDNKKDYTDKNGCVYCVYTLQKLGNKLGYHKSSIQRSIKRLKESGLIATDKDENENNDRIYVFYPKQSEDNQHNSSREENHSQVAQQQVSDSLSTTSKNGIHAYKSQDETTKNLTNEEIEEEFNRLMALREKRERQSEQQIPDDSLANINSDTVFEKDHKALKLAEQGCKEESDRCKDATRPIADMQQAVAHTQPMYIDSSNTNSSNIKSSKNVHVPDQIVNFINKNKDRLTDSMIQQTYTLWEKRIVNNPFAFTDVLDTVLDYQPSNFYRYFKKALKAFTDTPMPSHRHRGISRALPVRQDTLPSWLTNENQDQSHYSQEEMSIHLAEFERLMQIRKQRRETAEKTSVC